MLFKRKTMVLNFIFDRKESQKKVEEYFLQRSNHMKSTLKI